MDLCVGLESSLCVFCVSVCLVVSLVVSISAIDTRL